MPLFVDPQDVVVRMQVNEHLEGVYEVLRSAITGAQLQVQGLLSSSFVARQRTNLFYTDQDAFSALQPGGYFRLEVPSGFIRRDAPVTVTYGTSWTTANGTVDPTLMQIDYERGYVLLDARKYRDFYVQVQCTTGFLASVPTPAFKGIAAPWDEEASYLVGQAVTLVGATYLATAPNQDAAPPDPANWVLVQYRPEPIPEELYEAILSFVPIIFDGSQTTNRNAQAKQQYQDVADRGRLLLQKFARVKGFSFRSLN